MPPSCHVYVKVVASEMCLEASTWVVLEGSMTVAQPASTTTTEKVTI